MPRINRNSFYAGIENKLNAWVWKYSQISNNYIDNNNVIITVGKATMGEIAC